jgi:TPR repeat protein
MDCWDRLGISATENKRDVKRAYAKLLKNCHPDDDPEGFQALNSAYKQALDWDFEQEADGYEQEDLPTDVDNTLEKQDTENDEIATPVSDRSEATPDNEITSDQEQKEATAAQAEEQELFDNAEQFLRDFAQILENPKTRKNAQEWHTLLSNEHLKSFTFRQTIGLHIFDYLSQFYSSNIAINDGAFIPKKVVNELAEILDWRSNELELIKYFSAEEVSLVMRQAYGKEAVASEDDEPTNWKKMLYNFFIWIMAMNLLYRGFTYLLDSKEDTKPQEEQPPSISQIDSQDKTEWFEGLLACDKLKKPAQTRDFDNCLKLAMEGWIRAQNKIAWLYSLESEHKSIQKTYNWLEKAGEKDEQAKLLSHIILIESGNTEKDKQRGESGLIVMADQGVPAAKAYLASLYFLKTNKLPVANNDHVAMLEEANHQDYIVVGAVNMAKFYFNGFDMEKDISKTREVIEKEAYANFPVTTNNIAWFLATLENNELFETDYAVKLAESVVSDPLYEKRILYLDTLAATYAAAGRFKEASETQQLAIQLLTDSTADESTKSRYMKEFIRREQLYKERKRETSASLDTDRTTLFNDIVERVEIILFNHLHDSVSRPTQA